MIRVAGVILLVVVCTSIAIAQFPNTGFPPFGSFENGKFDAVNRQNLNTHFEIPVVSVPGRGTNFNFSIAYDSLIWTQAGDPPTWTAVDDNPNDHTGWGWKLTPALGTISSQTTTNQVKCFDDPQNPGWWEWVPVIKYYYAYRDGAGTYHNFPPETDNTCTGEITGGFPAFAYDGSGYQITSLTTVINASGVTINPASGLTDSNGNQINGIIVNSSETDWRDAASRFVLKIIKTASAVDYKYQDTSGNYQTIHVILQSLPIRTSFGCAVGDSSGTANVPVEIDLPDGRKYMFSYEPTPNPSYPNYYTGRLKSVTLPTGGSYTYEYLGANDSINCTTGETTSLKRTVSDGSTNSVWTFALQADGSMREVTPEGNRAVFSFTSDGKAQTQRIQNGDTDNAPVLRTVSTTYTSSSLPFTKTDTVILEDNTQSKTEVDLDAYGNATEIREYAFGSGAPGGLVRRTSSSYTASNPTYAARNILDRLTETVIKDANGVVKSHTTISYDQNSLTCVSGAGQHDDVNFGCSFATRGNPTSITTYADAANSAGAVTRNMYYDSLGNLRKVDGNVPTQTWDYSATTHYTYPDSSTVGLSPLMLTTSATYNSYTGLVATATDENNKTTQYTYEPVTKRLSQVQRADGALINYSYDDSARKVTVKTPLDGSAQVQQISLYDPLGRLVNVSAADSSGGIVSSVDTQYDSSGRAYRVSNPYTGSAQYWTETRFDPLGRPTMVIPPDGTQSSNRTTYSYAGNAVTVTDPAGNQRRTYTDALGRLVQVDEPGLDSGLPGKGSVTISGSEQSTQVTVLDALPGKATLNVGGAERSAQVTTQPATKAAGSVTISGSPDERKVWWDPNCGSCWDYVWNSGSVTVTVNGFSKSVGYGGNTNTPSGLASSLATAFNADPSSPVTATTSSNVLTLTSKATGNSANYPLSTSCTYDSDDGFSSCSFSGTRSGATLTGGHDAVITTVYDSGTVSLTVNGFSKSVTYGQSSSLSSLASALASAFNGDSNSPVTATPSGSAITVTAKQTGANTNYGFTTGCGTTSQYFSGCSFSLSPGSGALSGGRDTTYNTVYDAGTVTIAVNGIPKSVTYGQGSTPATVAAALATAMTQDGAFPATGSANGATISITSRTNGANTNYSLSTSSATTQNGYFSNPSFTASGPSSLSGGRDPLPTFDLAVPTYYAYSVLDQLTTVTQGAQTRSFAHDDLGRLITESNPETGTVCYGILQSNTCVNGYDGFGNLVKRTDARGVVTTYTRDALGRLTTTDYNVAGTSAQATTSVVLSYGNSPAQNNNGRLLTMTDGTGSATYSYDILGEVTGISKVVAGVTYNIGYSYNAGGAMKSITYPSGRVVQQDYDDAGRLNQIHDAAATYASGFGYGAAGQVTAFDYGNSIHADFGFNNRLQLSSLSYKNGVTPVFGLSYDYGDGVNNNGVIHKITDNVDAGRTVNYTYDEMGRLKTAVTQGSTEYPRWGLQWNYDRYGNRTAQNQTAGTVPHPLTPTDAATNHISGTSYDLSGNVTLDSSVAYKYDAENRLVDYGGGSATYGFDGNGLRVKRTYGSTTVYIFSGGQVIAEYASGAAPGSPTREYIYSGGLLAKLEGGNTTYYYPDHLSMRMTKTGSTTVEQGHYPFGDSWYGGNEKWKFTSYERDTESNNDYAVFRSYVNRYGRFLTPDPAGIAAVDLSNPQTWNRYAYTTNNPMNATDPWGLMMSVGCTPFTCMDGGGGEPSCLSCNGGLNPAYGPQAVLLDGVQVDPSTGRAALASKLGLYVVDKKPAIFTTWACPHEICGIYYAVGELVYGVSFPGSEFIKSHEGWVDHLYDDAGPGKGNCTIAYGHLVHRGPCDGSSSESAYKKGISAAAGERLFKQDLENALSAVAASYPWGLVQTQIDMLADFVFNAGAGNYSGRSGVGNLVRNGDSSLIPSFIMGWSAYGGSLGRRNQEATIFNWGYP